MARNFKGVAMARSGRAKGRGRRQRNGLAQKLIGAGLFFGLVPLVFGHSPWAAAFRPMAPLGWFLFSVGCGLLWWQVRSARARPLDGPAPEQLRQPLDVAPLAAAPAPTAWGTAVFEVIEWRRFEALVEALFAQAGFETRSQSHGADEGIDIWLYSRNQPGAPVSVVQCKHWQGKRVGVDKVRELRGVMAAKDVTRGQFATTSTFTDDAIDFARGNGINLLDVKALLALIAQRSETQQRELLAVALEGDYSRPTCVNCGLKMVERNARKGGAPFWGCKSFPRCKTTMPMRGATGTV